MCPMQVLVSSMQSLKCKFVSCTKRSQDVHFPLLRLIVPLCYHCFPNKQMKYEPLSHKMHLWIQKWKKEENHPSKNNSKESIKTSTNTKFHCLQNSHPNLCPWKLNIVFCQPRKLAMPTSTTLVSVCQKYPSFVTWRMDKPMSRKRKWDKLDSYNHSYLQILHGHLNPTFASINLMFFVVKFKKAKWRRWMVRNLLFCSLNRYEDILDELKKKEIKLEDISLG